MTAPIPAKLVPVEQPMLGLATTRQLLEELTARIEVVGELDYKTTETDAEHDARKTLSLSRPTAEPEKPKVTREEMALRLTPMTTSHVAALDLADAVLRLLRERGIEC